MRVIELTAPRIDALQAAEYETPCPGMGEVLIQMRAASLNYLDIAVATGGIPVKFPLVPIADGAGEIAALGERVTGWSIGDRVIPHFLPDWQDGAMTSAVIVGRRGLTLPGSLAEYVVAPASSLVAIPKHLSFKEAATLPIAATTAWRGVRISNIGPGRVALLLGTGGVSIFALQFAKAHGAKVIITSSSDEKLERARTLGADLTINYRKVPDWDQEVLRLTEGLGADLVLETGGTDTFQRSLNAAAIAGTIFVIGFLSGSQPLIDVFSVMEKSLRIQGNTAGPVADLRAAVAAITAHEIKPVVDKTFEMSEAIEAYSHLQTSGQLFGKIAINIS